MSEVLTLLDINRNGDVTVERRQDAQDIVDLNKHLRDQPQHGRDWHHKWNLPVTMVERFYNEYAGAGTAVPPMNEEFWRWVDEKMKDPQYSKFRTDDKSNPFFSGYKSKR